MNKLAVNHSRSIDSAKQIQNVGQRIGCYSSTEDSSTDTQVAWIGLSASEWLYV